jgi:AraC family transcriptional regulator of adaptative response/methylated-DNA-[protein]-cysteine methyltransferase
MKPGNTLSAASKEILHFGVADSSLGPVLVAASGKGICAVFMGDDPADLVAELRRRFPKADLEAGDEAFGRQVARVIDHIEAPGLDWDLPLDLRGTAFQQRVWQALREIPAGTTTDYTRISEKVGRTNAGRAVAGACGSNPVAVAVPCHRVVRSDGGLSGYRWGVERKRALLERESKA